LLGGACWACAENPKAVIIAKLSKTKGIVFRLGLLHCDISGVIILFGRFQPAVFGEQFSLWDPTAIHLGSIEETSAASTIRQLRDETTRRALEWADLGHQKGQQPPTHLF
jgi:hypothetical protein